ncbi:hypothetical protein MANES_13G121801v8 [Manihot esculenta]|uniref:Uncharacterized protein n=1 Tax=Manihot esculenta TaxID=3983 RepID=A0ACB7GN93_MANES|nr:hypothetical protein MANES_13G121801v8 [Manihot esculenta]
MHQLRLSSHSLCLFFYEEIIQAPEHILSSVRKSLLWNHTNPTAPEIHSIHFLHTGFASHDRESVGHVAVEANHQHTNKFFRPLNLWPFDEDCDAFNLHSCSSILE